jgi:hypothetical protein
MLLYWSIDQSLICKLFFFSLWDPDSMETFYPVYCVTCLSNFKSFCQLLYNQSHVSQLLPFGSWRSFCLVEGQLTVEKMGLIMKTKCWVLGFPLPTWKCIYSWRNRHWKIGFWQALKFEHKPLVASADSEEVHEFLLPLFYHLLLKICHDFHD